MFGSRNAVSALRMLAQGVAVCLAGIVCMPAASAPEAGATYDRNSSGWMERSRMGSVTRPAGAQSAVYSQPAYQQQGQQYGTAAVVSTPQSQSSARRSASSGTSTKSSPSKSSKSTTARKTPSKSSSSEQKSSKSSTSKGKASTGTTDKSKSSSSGSSAKSKTSTARSSKKETEDKAKSSASKATKEKEKEKEEEKQKQPEPSSEKKETPKEEAKAPEKPAAPAEQPEAKKQPEAASASSSVRPRWLPVHRPVVPVRPLLYPWVQEVTVAERKIAVLQPDKLVVEMPPPAVAAAGAGDAARREGPLVEFGRLADQRIAELRAYEAKCQAAADGVTSCPDGRYHKAYFRFPVKSVQVSVSPADPSILDGEIAYDQTVHVQTGDSPEAILKEPGQPSKDTPPAATSEKYRFRNGEWVYIEDK